MAERSRTALTLLAIVITARLLLSAPQPAPAADEEMARIIEALALQPGMTVADIGVTPLGRDVVPLV